MTHWWPQLEFLRPEWLSALLVLPLLVALCSYSLVDLPRRQMLASLVIRTVIAGLLVLSLAGLNLLSATQRVFVVFAVDQSLSVGDDEQTAARTFIRSAIQATDTSRCAVLPFASAPDEFQTAQVWQSEADRGSGQLVESQRNGWREGTDLQAAINIAVAGIPPEFVPHVVLLSDGNETLGDVLSAVAAQHARVSTIPLATRDDPEMQVSAVIVPTQVADEKPFNVEVVIDSNHDDEAIVEVFRGDYRILAERKQIAEGENRFQFPQQVDRPTEFTARLVRPSAGPDGSSAVFRDTLLDNNTASGLVFTSGKPRVLLIERVPEVARPLEWALAEEGILVDVRPPQAMPDSLTDLQNYEVLMLSNVPANDLSAKQMDVIRAFVSELGGGFIMLGGDESFGLGGYYRTVVEDVLPVRSDFEKEKEKPGLGMVLIIDKSGSMGGQKIELAKDAARATVELLGNKDQIGVIAFDGSPHWVSQMTSAARKSAVIDGIASIESGGGTTLYPAMQEAFIALQGISARLKHVIILTDGYSTPGDVEGIAQDMAAQRITVSTVGLGDVDQNLLERIAEIGHGRSYFCTDATSVPQIFARETVTASKSAINEEPFVPLLARATPVLNGINFDDAPFLLGYVVTQPKTTSEVILVQPESRDPVLCWWRYGLGMSVAFTSDAKGRWAADWLTWDGFNRFWAQVVRHCMRKSETRGMTVDLQRRGRHVQVVIDSVNPDGQFLNKAACRLTLVSPQLKAESVTVQQTAPGRYTADFELAETGAWNLQVTQTLDGEIISRQTRGIIVGYNDELRLRKPNEELLKSIAEVSGGTFRPKAYTLFDAGESESAAIATPLWPWLLSLAALLFVVDVAFRRLDLSRIFGDDVHRSTMRI